VSDHFVCHVRQSELADRPTCSRPYPVESPPPAPPHDYSILVCSRLRHRRSMPRAAFRLSSPHNNNSSPPSVRSQARTQSVVFRQFGQNWRGPYRRSTNKWQVAASSRAPQLPGREQQDNGRPITGSRRVPPTVRLQATAAPSEPPTRRGPRRHHRGRPRNNSSRKRRIWPERPRLSFWPASIAPRSSAQTPPRRPHRRRPSGSARRLRRRQWRRARRSGAAS
jgi:hypothetical protein